MGFEITMFYVALSNVNRNIERVAMIVKNGGHSIPIEEIIRRTRHQLIIFMDMRISLITLF